MHLSNFIVSFRLLFANFLDLEALTNDGLSTNGKGDGLDDVLYPPFFFKKITFNR